MNKKLLIIIAVVVVVLLAGGGIFVLSSHKKASSTVEQTQTSQDQTIGTLKPEDIGLKLQMSSKNHQLKVIVEKVSDIASLDYDITYNADIPKSELAPGEQGGQVERGFSDNGKISSGQTKYESKTFDLGSCSSGTCRYDTGVTGVSIIMKVTKKDGKVYQVKDSVTF